MAKGINRHKLEWNKAYSMLADLLAKFYEEYGLKSPHLLYKIIKVQNEIIPEENWFKNLETHKFNCIDPIHVFASFNNIRQKTEDRSLIFYQWVGLLGGKQIYNQIDFQGCPSLLSVKILTGRKTDEQLDIWRVFYDIYKIGKSVIKDDLLSNIKRWYGINFNSFTIFLFWINCDTFLSLDKNTVNYLIKSRSDFIVPKTFSDYLNLLNSVPSGLNKTIVTVAYDRTLIDKLTPSKRSTLSKFTIQDDIVEKNESKAKISFRFIALNIKKGLPLKFRKNLKEVDYIFYKGYKFENDSITIEEKDLFDLYSNETHTINISLHAIVGRNGSGKSALSELLYIAINNLYYRFTKDKLVDNLDWVPGINMQLFFQSYGIFRIDFKDEVILAYEYIKIAENKFQRAKNPIPIDKVFLEKFFYTLSVNYSLHGLNSKHADWLEKLFVKNDGYETPIVLEPNRVKGHIDIHRQEGLARSRFLSNLMEMLEVESLENEVPGSIGLMAESARFIRENIEVKFVKLKINPQKTSTIFKRRDGTEIKFKEEITNYDKIIYSLQTHFKIYSVDLQQIDFNSNNSEESISLRYVIRKLYKIANLYKPYINLFWNEETEDLIDPMDYVAKLKTDRTHVINKLFQAINFLNKKISYSNATYDLNTLLANLTASKIEHLDYNDNRFETIHLLPPSFFTVQIEIIDKKSENEVPFPFEQLSSGERQQIYSINSIVYHLKNLDSIDFEGRITYRCVNIHLDEVELYAHPEMQREYISHLLSLIKKFEWINISGINICFITHSPFILSDIPLERILFLDQSGIPSMVVKTKTFGANIHELLVNGFFLSNTIGEFAITKIENIVSFHTLVVDSNESELGTLKDEYESKKKLFEYTINSIGEDYISGVLKNHIIDIEKRLDKKYYQKEKLKELEHEVARLKGQLNA